MFYSEEEEEDNDYEDDIDDDDDRIKDLFEKLKENVQVIENNSNDYF